MKKILLMMGMATLMACGNSKQNATTNAPEAETIEATAKFYGEKITEDSVQSINDLKTLMGDKKELAIKLEGQIDAVCQKKGCWMDLKNAKGESMRVTFKDYGFFMPKDAAGQTAIVDGVAKIEETSVADLQEYAKDAGKSDAEIKSITMPKQELVFEANGVILK